MIYFDTETCGLHGAAVLIQWAEDDGPIQLFSPWTRPIKETLALIEYFCEHPGGVCAFNLAFDWFHLQKLYCMFRLHNPEWFPDLHISEIVAREREAIWGPCIKPQTALDLMLFAKRGPYQSVMDRKDIVIRRVPAVLADRMVMELDARTQLRDIYFARNKDKKKRWGHRQSKRNGVDQAGFRDVVLAFAAYGGLKNVAIDAFGEDPSLLFFQDVEVEKIHRPAEVGWAPFANIVPEGKKTKKGKLLRAWPSVIQYHIDHWTYNKKARVYAEKDVEYLRRLRAHWGKDHSTGMIPAGDDDSILACCVASTRWRGYAIDRPKMVKMINSLKASIAKAPRDAAAVKRAMEAVMNPMELMGFTETNKKVLEKIEEWKNDDGSPHPAAIIAKDVAKARTSEKLLNMFLKILRAGRLHASFKVIGTLSGRMSGTDGLNVHAINRADTIRECFLFADAPDEILSGGDYASFEVSIAEATYKDPKLREELMSGLKMHALFGMSVRKGMTYEEIKATEGTEDDVYSQSKTCVFAIFYGAMAAKIAQILQCSDEEAEKILNDFMNKYKEVGVARAIIFDQFCSMRQPEQYGAVYWKDPADYIEDASGFRRYFTIENAITKMIFEMGNQPPKDWNNIKQKIVRRKDGTPQFVAGAARSALFGAAFGLQGLNMRAACNHVIQAFGAAITKFTQRKIWDLQPNGINNWKVRPSNYHDEINVAHIPSLQEEIHKTAKSATESFREQVPLIKIDWKSDMRDWSGKHG